MSHRSSSNRPGAGIRGGKEATPQAAASNRSRSDDHAVTRSTPNLSSARRSVSGLSDRGLLNVTAKLVKTERLTTLEILVHLIEIERRELYLGLGYGSMYDYCVNHLGYSRSAAWRRIHSARCILRFPEVYALLETGALNLTTLSMVATALTKENKTELLGRIRGRSQDEVENVLASYRPPAAFRDRVKPVRVTVPVTTNPPAPENLGFHTGEHPLTSDSSTGSFAPAGTPALNRFRAATHSTEGGSEGGSEAAAHQLTASDASVVGVCRSGDPSGVDKSSTGSVGYIIKKQLLIQFLASEGFMAKYQEARSLLSNTLAELSFEAVFETLLDDYLDRHGPAKKQERREKRAAARKQREKQQEKQRTKGELAEPTETQGNDRANGDDKPSGSKDKLSRKKFDEHSRSGSKIILLTSSGGEDHSDRTTGQERGTKSPKPGRTRKQTRDIPAKTRDAVFIRDKNRCTHVGTNGKRCTSTHRLQIDHIVPYARGGTHALSNLRLLCAKHNKLEAKRVYGAAKIDAHCRRE